MGAVPDVGSGRNSTSIPSESGATAGRPACVSATVSAGCALSAQKPRRRASEKRASKAARVLARRPRQRALRRPSRPRRPPRLPSARKAEHLRQGAAVVQGRDRRLDQPHGPVEGPDVAPGFQRMGGGQVPIGMGAGLVVVEPGMDLQRHPLPSGRRSRGRRAHRRPGWHRARRAPSTAPRPIASASSARVPAPGSAVGAVCRRVVPVLPSAPFRRCTSSCSSGLAVRPAVTMPAPRAAVSAVAGAPRPAGDGIVAFGCRAARRQVQEIPGEGLQAGGRDHDAVIRLGAGQGRGRCRGVEGEQASLRVGRAARLAPSPGRGRPGRGRDRGSRRPAPRWCAHGSKSGSVSSGWP